LSSETKIGRVRAHAARCGLARRLTGGAVIKMVYRVEIR